MSNKKTLLIILVVVFIVVIVGGIYWYFIIQDNDINTNTEVINGNTNTNTFTNVNSDKEELLIGSLTAQCDAANGIWENGKCRAKECFDLDGHLGENSKYIPNRMDYIGDKIAFSDRYMIYGSPQISDGCDEGILQEAVCPEEINSEEDFVNSYVEYRCEEGCFGKAGSCNKSDYNVNGVKIKNIRLGYNDNSFLVPLSVDIGANGIVIYEWEESAPGASVISESTYTNIYDSIIRINDLFFEMDDIDDLGIASGYYSPDNQETELYWLHYQYYSKDEEEISENLKTKGFICNINCPQNFIDLVNQVKDFTPYNAPPNKHYVPQFIYLDECEESGNSLSCWYKYMATNRPDSILGDYDLENIFFTDIDYKLDSDNDSIPNFNEKYLGTDIQSNDTDSDGYDDLEEIEGGYNPAGDGRIEYKINEISNILESKCEENGGNIQQIDDNYNPNCWGIESENDCLLSSSCQWTNYDYCKPEMIYCLCESGQKIYPDMFHSFNGTCN